MKKAAPKLLCAAPLKPIFSHTILKTYGQDTYLNYSKHAVGEMMRRKGVMLIRKVVEKAQRQQGNEGIYFYWMAFTLLPLCLYASVPYCLRALSHVAFCSSFHFRHGSHWKCSHTFKFWWNSTESKAIWRQEI